MTLERNTEYRFDVIMYIKAEKGPLFIIDDGTATEKYAGSPDFKGLPILPSMSVYSDKKFVIQNHVTERPEQNNV